MTDRDLSNLCLHTVTLRPWPVETTIDRLAASGVGGITLWRHAIEDKSLHAVAARIRASGLTVVSLCRGGFFASRDPAARRMALDDNFLAIDQAAELGAPLLVMVCGADPGQTLAESRQQIADGLSALLPRAAAAGVHLGIEPLHPMYADSRSAINTLRQATDMALQFDSPWIGVVADVYHLWWDPDLETEITRCGEAGKLMAFHISDWKTPTTDLLNDREIMGEGCIPLQQIQRQVLAAGFDGYHEVEIFSNRYWSLDQEMFLEQIITAYLQYQKGQSI